MKITKKLCRIYQIIFAIFAIAFVGMFTQNNNFAYLFISLSDLGMIFVWEYMWRRTGDD